MEQEMNYYAAVRGVEGCFENIACGISRLIQLHLASRSWESKLEPWIEMLLLKTEAVISVLARGDVQCEAAVYSGQVHMEGLHSVAIVTINSSFPLHSFKPSFRVTSFSGGCFSAPDVTSSTTWSK
jgi:hypothetical protein